MNTLLGIGLIAVGCWMAIVQAKNLINDKPNTLGGVSGLLIIGIGCIISGIILVVKALV